MIGLGRMGGNMVTRLVQGGHQVVAYDRSPEAVQTAVDHGATGANALSDLVSKLQAPRAVWVMVPAGGPTEDTIKELAGLLSSGDTIIDGGNSNWHDSMRRAAELEPKGLRFVDAGTSGGVWGLQVG